MSTSASPVQGGRLADFILSQNEAFQKDLKGNNAKGWHIATGNEAGDLDSLASAVGFAFLATTLNATRTVPLVLTPSKLMYLRPENLLSLQRANLPVTSLLHADDLAIPTSELAAAGVKFDLVDHNTLLPIFGSDEIATSAVDGIVDHHQDEGSHPGAAIRLVRVPTGSTASLVTQLFMPQWRASLSSPAGLAGSPVPPELATLLLSAILIDTHGLKEGGKAEAADYSAAAFLYPISTLAPPNTTEHSALDAGKPPTPLTDYADLLVDTKYDVSGMSVHDLLLRDYKQYALPTASTVFPALAVGLSTVPVGLKEQLEDAGGWQPYLATLDAFMAERAVDIEGVLTTFKSENRGKSKRELFFVIRIGGAIPDIVAARSVLDTIVNGLEATGDILSLEPWAEGKTGKKAQYANEAKVVLNTLTRVGFVWDQKNAKATRKQVAPALMSVIHGIQ